MPATRRILVAFLLPEALHNVLEGISRYVRQAQCPWQVLLCVNGHDFRAAFVQSFADGAITGLGPRSRDVIALLRRKRTPVVNVVRDLTPRVPSVLSDNVAIGALGAQYFCQRGFRQFAFVGIETLWSRNRYAGFAQALERRGLPAPLRLELQLEDFEYASKVRAVGKLRRWLAKIPPRTAIMCASDFMGRTLLNACAARGIDVPGTLAVLGVDNFPSECQIGPVTLSSVAQDFERIGYEAAALLDQIMKRRDAGPAERRLVPPGRLHVRTSTDVLAFEDPVIVSALRLIHQHGPTGVSIKELLTQVPLSRKWLDHRFKQAVGHTPSEEIRRCRMQHVRDLVAETDMPLRQIAARCRFSCVQNLLRSFRCAYGLSPQAYRRSLRQPQDDSPEPRVTAVGVALQRR